ncbi:MAG: pyridoxal phosphate-dependent aminotransferase, partial [Longimicrobiales bacterium]
MEISRNLANISPSATLAVAALAREMAAEGRKVIDLSAGEPDFPTPAFIAEAGTAAIDEGRTRYTPVAGTSALREAIAAELSRGRAQQADAARVVVSGGAKQALFNACFALFGPGDRVLIPAPYWTSYPEIVRLARAEPVAVRGSEARAFKISPAELDEAFGDDVRGLLLNSPSNPTGAVYDRDELAALVEWADRRGVAIISDEIYNRICFTHTRAPGLLDVDGGLGDQNVVIGGASKNYAMTGWRIGYSYAAPALTAAISTLQSHTTSNANTPAQYAATAAFSEPGDAAARAMATTFRERRDLVLGLVQERLPDTGFVRPDGAFYLFFRHDGFETPADTPGSVGFCRWLLDRTGVALVPGAAFGDDRYVRLSFATTPERLEAGITRLADAVKT